MARTAQDMRDEMQQLLADECNCEAYGRVDNLSQCQRCRQITMLFFELTNFEAVN